MEKHDVMITDRILGISDLLRISLVEEYANEARPSDGQIYRKIRQYRLERQHVLENRWWTRLSSHKAKNLKQLLRNKTLTAAFDSLLKVPALLEAMRLGSMHKLLAMRSDEVGDRACAPIRLTGT